MAPENAKTGKRDQAQSKNEKESQSARSEKRDQQRSGEEKSNRSSSKVNMPKLEAGKSNRTTDHDVIRQWVEDRGGSPASVKATEGKEDPGLLRINFPGYSGKYSLEDISWEEFFKKFDEKNLEFLYQDQTKGGKTSRFFKLVNRVGSSGGASSSGSRSRSRDEGNTGSKGRNERSKSRSNEKEK